MLTPAPCKPTFIQSFQCISNYCFISPALSHLTSELLLRCGPPCPSWHGHFLHPASVSSFFPLRLLLGALWGLFIFSQSSTLAWLVSLSAPCSLPGQASLFPHWFQCYISICCCCLITKSFQLCDPMDCSPPGSSVPGISQARILEWIAISFFRESSWPRDQTQVSCILGRLFTIWATRKVWLPNLHLQHKPDSQFPGLELSARYQLAIWSTSPSNWHSWK